MLPKETPTNHPHAIYFVFGGPGAGKGTICKRPAQEFGLAHICPGDLLRTALEQETLNPEIREKVQQAMKDGKLAPVSTILAILQEAFLHADSPVLLDGFPRSVEQMEAFEALFGPVQYGLHLACSREFMERRVLGRAQASGRVDDNVETLCRRFRQHEEEATLCVERLKECGRLIEFCSDGDLNHVYQVVKSTFREILVED